jgi:hypothetical protein
MTLVPKRWYADAKPNERHNYVEIEARDAGLFGWLLALLKINPTFFIGVGATQAVYQATSFTGYRKVILPIDSISSSFFGYYKPWKAAISLFMVFFAGAYLLISFNEIGAGLGVLTAGMLIAMLYYFLNKELLIGLTDNIGRDYSLVLKKSVIGNQEINEQQMELVTRILLAIINDQKSRKQARPSSSPAGSGSAASPSTATVAAGAVATRAG